MNSRKINRRDLLQAFGVASASLMLSPIEVLAAHPGLPTQKNPNLAPLLSELANRTTSFEGAWSPQSIEGRIPLGLTGTLFRNGPGSKSTYGTPLNHFFDGDAYITRFHFTTDGQVSVRSKFVETVERQHERREKKMLYSEFGTLAPRLRAPLKNPPSVHVSQMANRLLTFSESAAPIAIDPETLEALGAFYFDKTLPTNVSFSAHGKTDPLNGDVYNFGISQSLMPALKVYRIAKGESAVKEIASVSLGGFYPIHDMMLTENYVVLVVPPVYIGLMGAALRFETIADQISYQAEQPLRIILVRKDGSAKPVVVNAGPAAVVYHHLNAYEDATSGNLVLSTVLIDDDSIFEVFKLWSMPNTFRMPNSAITRFEIDLNRGRMLSRQRMSSAAPADFPCIDPRLVGQPNRYSYLIESNARIRDMLSFGAVICWDMHQGRIHQRAEANNGQTFGEPVFVPFPGMPASEEQAAWILHMGYDSMVDQSFLDIRTAVSLNLEARVWLDRYVPIGFHGSFVTS